MSQFDLYQLKHIQEVFQAHLTRKQNEYQPVKNTPESVHRVIVASEIDRTSNTLSVINDAIHECQMKEAR